MESRSLMDQAAVPSPTLWLSTGLSPVSPASLCAGKTSTGHNTPGVAFHVGNQTVMIFLFFTCLEMISRINCSHSRDGGEADHPVLPQILLLALLKDRSDICFPAGFGYFSTLSNETFTSRPCEEAKVSHPALMKSRVVLLLFTLLPFRILKSTVPASLMTFRMRHLTLQSPPALSSQTGCF